MPPSTMGLFPLNGAFPVALCYFTIICLVRTSALTPDGYALMEFKNSITNSTSILQDWQSADASPCHWKGITCNLAGNVSRLSVALQNFSGVISPSLGRLQSLQILDVSNNNLAGAIPPELGNCSALLHLYLFNNGFNGSIPVGLMKLQNLQKLDISNSGLSGNIPDEIGNLQNLTFLNIGGNSFGSQIPASIGRLLSLQSLLMYSCQFEGYFPVEVAALPYVQTLNLSDNHLVGSVPRILFNNTNLVSITLSQNNLSDSITTCLDLLSTLPSIVVFDVGQNNFYGTISASIGNATSLQVLLLDHNLLTGDIPAELGHLQQLTSFSVRMNNFTGQIPPELGQCSQLTELDMYGNVLLTGSLPPEIGLLSKLNYLSVGSCSLSGEWPLEIYNLTNLSDFEASQNAFNGTLSPKVGNWKNLTVLSIWGNSFSGTLPPTLSNCTLLLYLSLSSNSFEGTLVSLNFTNLGQLQVLSLYENNFTGPIPPTLNDCTQLVVIQLESNRFEGSLSGRFDNLNALQYLSLHYNNFTAPFPSGLADLQNIMTLYLSYNDFVGPLPSNLGMKAQLQDFRVGNNSFNGTVPMGLCEGNALTFLSIQYNDFTGSIPSSLDSCKTLSTLKACNNQLISISPTFGMDSALEYLDLSSNQLNQLMPAGIFINNSVQTLLLGDNQLYGEISTFEFAGVPSIQRLNLSMNNFTGSIPDSISSCLNLADYLDLSFNKLNGSVSPLAKLKDLQALYIQGNTYLNKDLSLLFGMANLANLDLALNNWQTPIPPEVGNPGELVYLNMSFGGFSGTIPSDFAKLQKLEVLDLSHNNLSGSIPEALGDMLSLTSVNISYNNLTGVLPSKWVKFWRASPESFIGNPSLCVSYSLNDQCMYNSTISTSSANNDRKDITIGSVIGILGLLILAGLGLTVWKRKISKKVLQSKTITEECPIYFISFTGYPILFEDVMAATSNMSATSILKKGAYGTVFRGIFESGTSFVLKVFKGLKGDAHINRSFLNEIGILGNVKHRNIAKILGYCQYNDTGFIMYEYIANGDLYEMLYDIKLSSNLDWPTRLRICVGVIHGLTYLHYFHDPPIVHRDIKPNNILLDDTLEPYITDFGIAKELCMKQVDQQEDASVTAFAGTYGYIAPEYGNGAKITPKMDIYSFGVLVLELLTGRTPVENFEGKLLHIVDYVRMKVNNRDGSLDGIVDTQILDYCTENQRLEILSVLDVALLCVQKNPIDRPSSREIEKLLHQIIAADDSDSGNSKKDFGL